MFTGIIESTGHVEKIERDRKVLKLYISHPSLFDAPALGSSIAVNGVCLTQSSHTKGISVFDVVEETLEKTNLGFLKVGDRVNLERSMKLGDRIDGHFVQGHVDGVAKLLEINLEKKELWIELPKELEKYFVEKGSLALEGISLTLAEKRGVKVRLAIIPTTWQITHLKEKKEGDFLNIEVDPMAKYIFRYLKPYLEEAKV